MEAAKNGHIRSMVTLGTMYLKGLGCELNISKAKAWFSAAAEFDDPEALCSLAIILLGKSKTSCKL
jgi:TPR repeat protein